MVLHLPGSISIKALITLSKESISLFSFLLQSPQQKQREKLKSFSNAVLPRVLQTPLSAPGRTKQNNSAGLYRVQTTIHSHILQS